MEAKLDKQISHIEKMHLMERYLSPQVSRAVLEEGTEFLSRSVRKRLTVFFSDVRGFTELSDEMEPEEVIKTMVHQFKKVFGPEMTNRASHLGMSEREAVILASIIEKETGLPEEKPLVSAVFHNRRTRKMPFQSDPTVIYGIKNFNGNLTKNDLQRPTPYNTYLKKGLPPGPIANPGKSSILAALYPAPVQYLYFVSRNDGSHQFSNTLREHNEAVWRYQQGGRRASH